MFRITASLILALVVVGPARAADTSEGKVMYEQYVCARCHGADAKGGTVNDAPSLAGLAADRIEQKVRRFIENRAHQDVLGGCGAPPTAGEIRKIAEYLATLSP